MEVDMVTGERMRVRGWRGVGVLGGYEGVVRGKKPGESHRGKKVGSKDKGFWLLLGGGTYENGWALIGFCRN